jgi:hypothetical protein
MALCWDWMGNGATRGVGGGTHASCVAGRCVFQRDQGAVKTLLGLCAQGFVLTQVWTEGSMVQLVLKHTQGGR